MKSKKGFTLVELSIVLVIIGLLIGGILVAQSMIESAKIQSFIREIQQFDAGVSNFEMKFNGLPGDSTKMGCTTYGGGSNICDDGLLKDSQNDKGGDSNGAFDGEIGYFWPAMQQSGFNYGDRVFAPYVAGNALDYSSTTPNTPLIKATIDAGVFAMQCFSDSTQNCYTIMKLNSSANNTIPMFSPAFAYAVDSKIDDGNALTGNIQDAQEAVDGGAGDGTCENGSGVYALNHGKTPTCWMQINILSSVGQANQ